MSEINRTRELRNKFYRIVDVDDFYKRFKDELAKGLESKISTFGAYCEYYKKLGWRLQ